MSVYSLAMHHTGKYQLMASFFQQAVYVENHHGNEIFVLILSDMLTFHRIAVF